MNNRTPENVARACVVFVSAVL